MKVAHNNCDFSASGDENDQDHEQEAENEVQLHKKKVIDDTVKQSKDETATYLVEPHCRHDEEKLDADCTEWQNATESDAEGRMGIPHLVGDMSSDLIGSHWNFNGILFEAEIASNEHQWGRNAEPKKHQRQQRCERSGGGRAIESNEDVDRAEQHSDNSRIEQGRQNRILLPFLSVAQFVYPGREISSKRSHEDVEQQQSCQKTSTIGRRGQSKQSTNHRTNGHRKNLNTRSCQDRKEHGGEGRRTEHIAMNQFPTRLFLSLFQRLHFIVRGDILVKGAEHDHGYDTSQEQHDHKRVDDREIVDFVVGISLQVHIPAMSPRQVRTFPLDIVGVNDFLVSFLDRLEFLRVKLSRSELITCGKNGSVLVKSFRCIFILVLYKHQCKFPCTTTVAQQHLTLIEKGMTSKPTIVAPMPSSKFSL